MNRILRTLPGNEGLEFLVRSFIEDKEEILEVSWVWKNNTKGGQDARILLATEYGVYLLSQKNPVIKQLKQSRNFEWDSLKYIKSLNKDSIILMFAEKTQRATLDIVSEKATDFLVKIGIHMRTIFFGPERPEFDFDMSYLQGFNTPKDAILKRMRFRAHKQNRRLPSGFVELVEDFLAKVHPVRPCPVKTVKLDRFARYWSYIDVFLDGLNVMPSITVLYLTHKHKKTCWNFLGEFFKTNQTITELISFEEIDCNFRTFVAAFEENKTQKKSKLKKLYFDRSTYDPEFFVQLSILIECIEINSLTIKGLTSSDGYNTMSALVANVKGFKNLRSFAFENCHFMNVQTIFQPLPQIHFLSIANSKIDISPMFKVLNDYTQCELININLSGNKFKSKIDPNWKLPESIEKIYVDNCIWKNDNLINLLKLINNRKTKFETKTALSISKIHQSQTDFDKFDAFLSVTSISSITHLIYDDNVIDYGLIEFISNCHNLSYLSVSGCFYPGDEHIAPFAEAISHNNTIRHLEIRGRGRSSKSISALGDEISVILDALKQNSSIVILNIDGNTVGDQIGTLLFETLLINTTLQNISFDDNEILDPSVLHTLFSRLRDANRGITVRYLSKDIESMKVQKSIRPSTLSEIERLRRSLTTIKRKSISNRSNLNILNTALPSRPMFLKGSGLVPTKDTNEEEEEENESENGDTNIDVDFDDGEMGDVIVPPVKFLPPGSVQPKAPRADDINPLLRNRQTPAASPMIIQNQNQDNQAEINSFLLESNIAPPMLNSNDLLECEGIVPPDIQVQIDRVNEEYVSDHLWVSLLDNIPEAHDEDFAINLATKFHLKNMILKFEN